MLAFIAKRLGLALLVALAVSVIAFFLLRLSGDVATAIAGEGARQEDIEMVRRTYGLDRPLLVQYFDWLWYVLRGDFGTSLFFKTDVIDLVWDKLPTTLTLGLLSLGFALLISVPLGVLAATFANSWIDRFALALAVIGQAMPTFFFALLLIMLFSVQLRWLPVSGSGSWANFVMPTVALGYYATPAFVRLVRAGMVEVLSADYIRTARAKGLPTRSVIFKHALRNVLAPDDPYTQDLLRRLVPPVWYAKGSWIHPLGTDNLGRDYLSRTLYGARISLVIGVSVMLISGIIGTALGLAAGYFGGRIDLAVTFLVTTRLAMLALLVFAINLTGDGLRDAVAPGGR